MVGGCRESFVGGHVRLRVGRLIMVIGGVRRAVCAAAAGWLLMGLLTGVQAQGKPRTAFAMDANVVEIPFVYSQHQILLTGEADGRKDLTLLFDTGASASVFDTSLHL